MWCYTLGFFCSVIISGKKWLYTNYHSLSHQKNSSNKDGFTKERNIFFLSSYRARTTFAEFRLLWTTKQSISILIFRFIEMDKYCELFYNIADMFWSIELNLLRFSWYFLPRSSFLTWIKLCVAYFFNLK